MPSATAARARALALAVVDDAIADGIVTQGRSLDAHHGKAGIIEIVDQQLPQ